MVTFGEVLSLATPGVLSWEKIWLWWVFRLLETSFATVADLKMLSYLRISYYKFCGFTFKNVSLSMQQALLELWKPCWIPGSVSIHSFWIVESSIFIAFVIMLENDDIFKLSIYLNICFFFLVYAFHPHEVLRDLW